MKVDIGNKVAKNSGKPFKSGKKINTIKSLHYMNINNLGYKEWASFDEDESLVEIGRLKLVSGIRLKLNELCSHRSTDRTVSF